MGDKFSNIESWNIINRFYSRVFGVYNLCANRVGCEVFEDMRAGKDEGINEEPGAGDLQIEDDNPRCGNQVTARPPPAF